MDIWTFASVYARDSDSFLQGHQAVCLMLCVRMHFSRRALTRFTQEAPSLAEANNIFLFIQRMQNFGEIFFKNESDRIYLAEAFPISHSIYLQHQFIHRTSLYSISLSHLFGPLIIRLRLLLPSFLPPPSLAIGGFSADPATPLSFAVSKASLW